MTGTKAVRRGISFCLLALAATICGGCYKHVVRVDGPAEDTYEIHESNLDKSRVPIVDDLIDAAEGEKKGRR